MSEVITAKNVSRQFVDGQQSLQVLSGIDLQLEEGERLFIFGRSGSGKSTLLHILAGLDDPTTGEVWVAGDLLAELSQTERASLRNQKMGFVYQFHHLLPEFNAQENVAMPLLIRGTERRQALARAADLLAEVELSDRLKHLPSQLSGGERLRVAVARSIIGDPQIVLADEPTGSLDAESARQVMHILTELSDNHKTALIVVTHDENSRIYANRTLHLKQGELVSSS